ncbi:MAG: choice-of-anchor F family protein [Pontibacterium sp.]
MRPIKPEGCPLHPKKTSVIGTAFAIALLSAAVSVQAGKITSIPAAAGASGFGGWNLDNVDVVLNGATSTFDEATGAYFFSADSDLTYQSNIDDALTGGTQLGIVLAKDWPVGEPAGIKIVNDDLAVKEPKPSNCVMATSYLEGHFLDSADPQQVTCSSPFQTHKRYKLAMLPSSVDGFGVEGIDLVFNVEDDGGSREYQIFQKINNWTDGRLEGFTVQVGFGLGAGFQSVADAGVALADLHISVPSDIWSSTQLANFSAGLFGPEDKHTGAIGFFDPNKRAGFLIDEYVDGVQPLTDTLHATTTLGSDYADVPAGALAASNQFGAWLPDIWLPYGIFFDDDGDPETDADLKAWYGYNPAISDFGWMSGSQDADGAFSTVPDAEIETMGLDIAYTMGEIDDLVNVGLNYVVTLGDVTTYPSATFTIRVTPTADTSGMGQPGYVGLIPDPVLRLTGQDAAVLLEPNPEFVVGNQLVASVGDTDLNLDPVVAETVDVIITSDDATSPGPLTLTLTEEAVNRGVFSASLPVDFSNVAVGSVVTMTYTDADTGTAIGVVKTSSTTAIVAPPSGVIQLGSATYSADENDASVVITVNRTGGDYGQVVADFDSADGTATAGADYQAVSDFIFFDNGETSKTFEVKLLDDTVYEGDETFTVTLSRVQGGDATLGALAAATVTIAENDAAPVVTPPVVTPPAEGSSGGGGSTSLALFLLLMLAGLSCLRGTASSVRLESIRKE